MALGDASYGGGFRTKGFWMDRLVACTVIFCGSWDLGFNATLPPPGSTVYTDEPI